MSSQFKQRSSFLVGIESFIFWSRWFQAPMYLGLIACQGIYVYRFGLELYHLISHATDLSETSVMLIILGLIDVAMIANLLYMVIIGGYETFVSKISMAETHPDRPDWLGHIDANLLKIKLATAIITISSIHLLKTFINSDEILASPNGVSVILSQVCIHLSFLLSAWVITRIDQMLDSKHESHPKIQ